MAERNRSGGDFLGALTLVFIVLKLIGHIDWSWAWVLAPLWLPLAVAIVLYLGILAYVTARRS